MEVFFFRNETFDLLVAAERSSKTRFILTVALMFSFHFYHWLTQWESAAPAAPVAPAAPAAPASVERENDKFMETTGSSGTSLLPNTEPLFVSEVSENLISNYRRNFL